MGRWFSHWGSSLFIAGAARGFQFWKSGVSYRGSKIPKKNVSPAERIANGAYWFVAYNIQVHLGRHQNVLNFNVKVLNRFSINFILWGDFSCLKTHFTCSNRHNFWWKVGIYHFNYVLKISCKIIKYLSSYAVLCMHLGCWQPKRNIWISYCNHARAKLFNLNHLGCACAPPPFRITLYTLFSRAAQGTVYVYRAGGVREVYWGVLALSLYFWLCETKFNVLEQIFYVFRLIPEFYTFEFFLLFY